MFDQFVNYINFKSTYSANKFIYYLSKTPIIKKLIPGDIYGRPAVRLWRMPIYIIKRLFFALISNLMLFLIYLLAAFLIDDGAQGLSFTVWAIVFSISFGFLKGMNKPSYLTEDPNISYTLINHLRMNPKALVVNNSLDYFLFGIINRLSLFWLLKSKVLFVMVLLSWMMSVKIMDVISESYYRKHEVLLFSLEGHGVAKFLAGLLYVASLIMSIYVVLKPQYFNVSSIYIYTVVLVFFFLSWTIWLKGIQKLKLQQYLAKNVQSNMLVLDDVDYIKDKNEKKLSRDFDVEVKGSGFKRLNHIFFNRYRNVWRKRFLITNLILLVLLFVSLYLWVTNAFPSDFKLGAVYGISIFAVYFMNFGDVIVEALYKNCDASLLLYNKYNASKNVLLNFNERLKKMFFLHLPQSLIFALIVSIASIAINPSLSLFKLFFIFVSFVSLGVFFCIHSLVLYYLLQPYDEKLEVRSIQHSIATTVTYYLVYLLSRVNLSVEMLVLVVFVSAFVYFFVASILIYQLAPKTFKIRR